MASPGADLVEQYRQLHAEGENVFSGRTILRYAWEVNILMRKTKAKSLLDFGCGKGVQYRLEKVHEWWSQSGGVGLQLGINLICYDPAWPPFQMLPSGTFDGVICADVLEHFPEEEVPAALDMLFNYAHRFVFIVTCCRPATRLLPDGRNCHLTVRPEEWWREQVEQSRARTKKRASFRSQIEFTP